MNEPLETQFTIDEQFDSEYMRLRDHAKNSTLGCETSLTEVNLDEE